MSGQQELPSSYEEPWPQLHEVLPGRILHVRIPLAHNYLDVVCVYQQVWRGTLSSVENAQARSSLLLALRNCLHALPKRNLLMVVALEAHVKVPCYHEQVSLRKGMETVPQGGKETGAGLCILHRGEGSSPYLLVHTDYVQAIMCKRNPHMQDPARKNLVKADEGSWGQGSSHQYGNTCRSLAGGTCAYDYPLGRLELGGSPPVSLLK